MFSPPSTTKAFQRMSRIGTATTITRTRTEKQEQELRRCRTCDRCRSCSGLLPDAGLVEPPQGLEGEPARLALLLRPGRPGRPPRPPAGPGSRLAPHVDEVGHDRPRGTPDAAPRPGSAPPSRARSISKGRQAATTSPLRDALRTGCGDLDRERQVASLDEDRAVLVLHRDEVRHAQEVEDESVRRSWCRSRAASPPGAERPVPAHDADPIRDGQRHLLIVGDVQDRDAGPPLEVLDLEPHLLAEIRVQVGERLVQQHDLGARDERARQRDALLLPAGELRGVAVLEASQVHLVDGLQCSCLGLVRRDLLDLERDRPRSRRPSCAATPRSPGRRPRCFAIPSGRGPSCPRWRPAGLR